MCESFEVVSISCGILNSFVGFLFIDRHYWYICFVILFFHFVQRRAEHPLPRSLPESKLSDLAERTDYEAFYNDTFLKGIYRVRVPGTTGHHKVKMVRKITANVSVLPLLRVNKLATSFNYLSRFIVIKTKGQCCTWRLLLHDFSFYLRAHFSLFHRQTWTRNVVFKSPILKTSFLPTCYSCFTCKAIEFCEVNTLEPSMHVQGFIAIHSLKWIGYNIQILPLRG